MLAVAPELQMSENVARIHGQHFATGERVNLTDTLDVIVEHFF
jgi:hypothetical protein